MMTREPEKSGCVSKGLLFCGILLLLAGLGINLLWFLYLWLKVKTLPLQLFGLYIGNLLPGLLMLALGIFISYFSRRRWHQLVVFGAGGLCIALSLFWAMAINAGTFAGVLMFSSDVERPTSGNTPQEMFRYTIHDPIPSSIRNLEGVGDTWQGYSIYLRFQASRADIGLLIAFGYKPVKCSAIADLFALPKGYNHFKPSWQPNVLSDKQCYQVNNVKNSWTHSGSHYLAIEQKSGTVYFRGIGA